MREERILKVLGYVDEKYIMAAAPEVVQSGAVDRQKNARKKQRHRGFKLKAAAAVIAVILIGAIFFQTPFGAAALEKVHEQVTKIIEVLFPPKDITVMPEITGEEVRHTAQGREPQETSPGFVIYVDEDRYVMTEENGVYYIRPVPVTISREEIRDGNSKLFEGLTPEEQEAEIDRIIEEQETFYASLPPCEIEIRELPEVSFEDAAAAAKAEFAEGWMTVSDTLRDTEPPRLYFGVIENGEWDSAHEEHYFYKNGIDGTFHLIVRTYIGATEGHGARLHAMLETFSVIAPQNTSEYEPEDDILAETMRKEIAYAEEQSDAIDGYIMYEAMTQADMNVKNQEKYELWDGVLNKLWEALKQTLDAESMDALTQEQLDWIAMKEAAVKEAAAEYEGGSLYPTVRDSKAAQLTRTRVYELIKLFE